MGQKKLFDDGDAAWFVAAVCAFMSAWRMAWLLGFRTRATTARGRGIEPQVILPG
jgi:hypothetical protein